MPSSQLEIEDIAAGPRHSMHDAAFGVLVCAEAVVRDGRVRLGVAARRGNSVRCLSRSLSAQAVAGTAPDVASALPVLLDWIGRSEGPATGVTIAVRNAATSERLRIALSDGIETGSAGADPRISARPSIATIDGLDDESILFAAALRMCRAAVAGIGGDWSIDTHLWRSGLRRLCARILPDGRPERPQPVRLVAQAARLDPSAQADILRSSRPAGQNLVGLSDALAIIDEETTDTRRIVLMPGSPDGPRRHAAVRSTDRRVGVALSGPPPPGTNAVPAMSMRDKLPLPSLMAAWHLATRPAGTDAAGIEALLPALGAEIAGTRRGTVHVFSDAGSLGSFRNSGYVASRGHSGIFGRRVRHMFEKRFSDDTTENESAACRVAFAEARNAFPDASRFVVWTDSVSAVRRFQRQALRAPMHRGAASPNLEAMLSLACQHAVELDVRWTKGHRRDLDDLSFGNAMAHALAYGEGPEIDPVAPSSTWTADAASRLTHVDIRFDAETSAAFLGLAAEQVAALGAARWLDVDGRGASLASLCLLLPRLRDWIAKEGGTAAG